MANKSRSNRSTNTTVSADDKPFPLLDLPAELRIIIYDHLFTSRSRTNPLPTDKEIKYSTAILYTSRFILSEAGATFQKHKHALREMTYHRRETLRQRVFDRTRSGEARNSIPVLRELGRTRRQFDMQRGRIANAVLVDSEVPTTHSIGRLATLIHCVGHDSA